jgi:hypothetical protein
MNFENTLLQNNFEKVNQFTFKNCFVIIKIYHESEYYEIIKNEISFEKRIPYTKEEIDKELNFINSFLENTN